MTDHQAPAPAASGQPPKPVPTPTSVLSAAVEKEKARKDVDADLMLVLESTVLRVEAADSAWEKAAAAIKKLAATRAESRVGEP